MTRSRASLPVHFANIPCYRCGLERGNPDVIVSRHGLDLQAGRISPGPGIDPIGRHRSGAALASWFLVRLLMWLPGRRSAPMHIAILSFDRPHYLREVLHSLRSQVSERDEVILVQDGARNAWSGRMKASPQHIQQCIDIFQKIVPWGTVLASEGNIGIALNYERAETHLFETLRRPHALILEDDLVLSPQYVRVIRSLLKIAHNDRRIAYVSACGDMWASLEEQRARLRELRHMHENWGFAMTREAWLDERPFRREYLDLLADRDYSERDGARIVEFYRQRGWKMKTTSQDSARWIASVELGKVRLTTFACHARYIGEVGQHFGRELYYRCGFHRTLMLDVPAAEPQHPTSAQIASWLERERERFREGTEPFYEGHGS
jgi:GT2 family glycosyltransferase